MAENILPDENTTEVVPNSDIKVPAGAHGIPDPKLKSVVGGIVNPSVGGSVLCPHCNQWISSSNWSTHIKTCKG